MLLTRIWRGQPGRYFGISTKSASGKWTDHFFKRSELSKVPDFIDDNKDKDLYFCPHGFNEPSRRKEHAVAPRVLWSDLDEVDPAKIKLKPTIAIESSPGRYVGLWLLDKEMDEVLNRRLSYFIGADKSGWDFSQVLRIPGTINYKYNAMPRTRILWSDGPSYEVKELQKILPAVSDESTGDPSEAGEIYRKWARRLRPGLRRELMSGRATHGKRSEVIWKLENELIETGLTEDEALVLIKASPWNKFAGRHDEDKQLRRELGKIVNTHLNGSKKNGKAPVLRDDREDGDDRLLFRSMDEVEEEQIDWIWYPYLARGELTIIEGDPGLGKSYLAQMICAHLGDGKELPSVKKYPTIEGQCVYFDIENSAGSVTKKRLVNNGMLHLERFIQCEEPFSIDDEYAWDDITEYFEQHHPLVAVFDTVNTYLGKSDSFKGTEAQQVFMRFRALASRYKCAVIVLRHLTKSSKERALYRGQGNIAFAGLARVVVTVGSMPEEEGTRVMAVTKLNIARLPKALTFTIMELPDTLKDRDRSKFEWGEFVDLSSEDILGVTKDTGSAGDREAAKTFLERYLDEGPQEVRVLERQAESRSINAKALKAACQELGVVTEVSGKGKEKRLWWALPDDPEPHVRH